MLPDLSSTSITAEVGRATVSAERFTTHGPNTVPVPESTACTVTLPVIDDPRSEEHTSELQSPCNLVCRLLLFNDASTTELSTLSLHDALPIWFTTHGPNTVPVPESTACTVTLPVIDDPRSEEHTSELQSPCNLVCRLLLE